MFCYFPRLDTVWIFCSALSGLLKHFNALFIIHQLPELLNFLIRGVGGLGKIAVENLS
jgi:hypothetical protein